MRRGILLSVTLSDIYTNSQHKDPRCRVLPIDGTDKHKTVNPECDKEKYKEMIIEAAETVLGYFGLDRIVYGNKKNVGARKWRWLHELRQERERDIKAEII
jgi:hypothetical protein